MIQYRRYLQGRWEEAQKPLPKELPLNLRINGQDFAGLTASPDKLTALIMGFLFNEGLVDTPEEVALLRVCAEDGLVEVQLAGKKPLPLRRIFTSGCGRGIALEKDLSKLVLPPQKLKVNPANVIALMKELSQKASHYRHSGGLHASALADGKEILLVAEDVGRHNTIDKICGEALLTGITLAGKWLLTTGRLSSDTVAKAARMRCPLLISRSSPTDWALKLALELNVSVIGYVRGESFHGYTPLVEKP